MIRAEIRLSSDGVQLVCPVFRGERLLAVVAGPAPLVLGALPDHGIEPENVTGLTEELRALWGLRKERPVEL